ncbi:MULTISPECIES: hypothetical protein [unclassified Streptomyces]|uniref:hypothetical protein n=1 Tax=Streptomyces TaxID=1883 RepID=UPI0029BCFC82|nr:MULTISPECIES: hypothetical protein [unclassified Streptomyces]MDX3370139.1 hypothetical protein [Streptomyces sp. ME02-6987-2C]MDX3404138.1 hypothetical protein [Streptomyces sp. ME01-18h]MDX3427090.1 hypothetical protein [Streptomyces sp. ME02-6985-2c]
MADVLVLGWDGETAPAAGSLAPGWRVGLSPVPTLVWAACLRAAWPRPERPPFPGGPFRRDDIVSLCSQLGADRDAVKQAVDRTLPEAGLIAVDGDELWLGAAVAALPAVVVEGLRRGHHLLPAPPADAQTGGGEPASVVPPHEVPADAEPAHEMPDGYVMRSAIATLETARRPVPRGELPMLADPAMRAAVERALLPCGRQLRQTVDGNWVTGFCDPLADALVAEGVGTLTAVDRAVLALVLLHTVAIPRAQGRHRHSRWTGEAHTVTLAELASNRRISKAAMRAALRRLRATGMIAETTTGRYLPGPVLDRMSEARGNLLWEDLILVGRPDGQLAAAIRRRRGLDAPVRALPGGTAETDRV